jgi:acetyl-CoA decarbonylase/synthase complex subunit beta
MSEQLYKVAISGAESLINDASKSLEAALRELGANSPSGYPETSYFLPIIYGITGKETKTLGELKPVLDQAKGMVKKDPTLENALNAGVATLIAAEIIEAIKYAKTKTPYSSPYMGFVDDTVLRKLGRPLVDGTIPAIAVVIGSVKDEVTAKSVGGELRKKNILRLMAGPIADQFHRAGISGIFFGPTIFSAVHAVNLAVRVALMFGDVSAGNKNELATYLRERVPVFILALGPLDPVTLAIGVGVMACGIPVFTDQQVPEIPGVLYSQPDLTKIINQACEARKIKLKEIKIDLPVDYGPAYEGKSIRKEQMYVEFGGGKSTAFEFVRTKSLDQVQDGKITLVGPDIDKMSPGGAHPLGIIVDIAGRRLEKDFEPIIERRIHQFLNWSEGIMHIAQRDTVWIRIDKDSYNKGLRLKHIGNILYTMYKSKFPTILEKIQITILTNPEDVQREIVEARKAFKERDARLTGLTEEEVDAFYGCTLCQSFAPNHVCIITPEKISLCGATSWFDAKVAYHLDPKGPNFVVPKGACIDPITGEWEGANKVAQQKSHGNVQRVNLHSIFQHPHTSCGCFEAIAFYIPEVDGIGLIHREFRGSAVNGMPFSTMAGVCSGGRQVEGFLGLGVLYMKSKKFLQADGGWKRIVWMPKNLKEQVKEAIPSELYDKIATEENVQNLEELKTFLKNVKHPVTERWT